MLCFGKLPGEHNNIKTLLNFFVCGSISLKFDPLTSSKTMQKKRLLDALINKKTGYRYRKIPITGRTSIRSRTTTLDI